MKVNVNGELRELPEHATVSTLVSALGLEGVRGVAIAVDAAVEPRSQWALRPLRDGADVLVIRATQGG